MGAVTTRPPITSVHPLAEACDGCSARALFEITLASGGTLFLCGHHTKRNMDQLVASGAEVKELSELD